MTVELLTVAVPLLTGLAGVAGGVVVTWLRARSRERLARSEHDEREAGRLWPRIEALEARLEARDERIESLSTEVSAATRAVADCQHDREECRRECDGLRRAVGELQGIIHRRDDDVTARIEIAADAATDRAVERLRRSTPPQWSAYGPEGEGEGGEPARPRTGPPPLPRPGPRRGDPDR